MLEVQRWVGEIVGSKESIKEEIKEFLHEREGLEVKEEGDKISAIGIGNFPFILWCSFKELNNDRVRLEFYVGLHEIFKYIGLLPLLCMLLLLIPLSFTDFVPQIANEGINRKLVSKSLLLCLIILVSAIVLSRGEDDETFIRLTNYFFLKNYSYRIVDKHLSQWWAISFILLGISATAVFFRMHFILGIVFGIFGGTVVVVEIHYWFSKARKHDIRLRDRYSYEFAIFPMVALGMPILLMIALLIVKDLLLLSSYPYYTNYIQDYGIFVTLIIFIILLGWLILLIALFYVYFFHLLKLTKDEKKKSWELREFYKKPFPTDRSILKPSWKRLIPTILASIFSSCIVYSVIGAMIWFIISISSFPSILRVEQAGWAEQSILDMPPMALRVTVLIFIFPFIAVIIGQVISGVKARKMKLKNIENMPEEVKKTADHLEEFTSKIANDEGVRPPNIIIAGIFEEPIMCLSKGVISAKNYIIIREDMLEIFNTSDLEAFMAHEIWHLKNDTRLLNILSFLSTFLFVSSSLFTSLIDFSRREYLADEFAAEKVGKKRFISALNSLEAFNENPESSYELAFFEKPKDWDGVPVKYSKVKANRKKDIKLNICDEIKEKIKLRIMIK